MNSTCLRDRGGGREKQNSNIQFMKQEVPQSSNKRDEKPPKDEETKMSLRILLGVGFPDDLEIKILFKNISGGRCHDIALRKKAVGNR